MKHRKFRLVLCDDLERWGVGVVGGREVQQRGDMGILTADSLHSTAETNATLKAIILQLKKKLYKKVIPSVPMPQEAGRLDSVVRRQTGGRKQKSMHEAHVLSCYIYQSLSISSSLTSLSPISP